MITKKITNFFKNLKEPSFGVSLPSLYTQKLINQLPNSRNNLELDREYAKIITYNNVIRLNNKEKVCLSALKQKSNPEQRANEINHLFLLWKLNNQRCQFLNDNILINPTNFKMGDIISIEDHQKYEVKTYINLSLDRADFIFNQYKNNNFLLNDVKFNICFEQLKHCNLLEFKTKLSNKLKIPITHINIYDFKEVCQEINVWIILDMYYNIDVTNYENEHERLLWINIRNCYINLDNRDPSKRYLAKLLNAHDNNIISEKKIKKNLKKLKVIKVIEEHNENDTTIDYNDVD